MTYFNVVNSNSTAGMPKIFKHFKRRSKLPISRTALKSRLAMITNLSQSTWFAIKGWRTIPALFKPMLNQFGIQFECPLIGLKIERLCDFFLNFPMISSW
jgi:hypothetical protein